MATCQTSRSQITSQTHIRVGNHQYANIDILWKTTYNKGGLRDLIGDRCFWFDDITVRFPDKTSSSCSFVEVQKRAVNVGHPNNYLTYRFNTRLEALQFAEKTNKEWLAFEGTGSEFLRSIND
jgi:hypothetical protein